MPRQLGDMVWYPRVNYHDEQITCPDCLGKRYLTVIMGDDSEVTIDCAGCQCGYDPPRGTIPKHIYSAVEILFAPITGMEDRNGAIEYHIWLPGGSYYNAGERDIFDTKEEAEARAAELVKERGREEAERLLRKEKPTHTWAWNATYHRGCIRRAEKDLEYHKAKLAVALQYKKEEAKV